LSFPTQFDASADPSWIIFRAPIDDRTDAVICH